MLCHKCPHQLEIDRLRGICCACSDRQIDRPPSAGGKRRLVSLDAMPNPEGIVGGLYARMDVPRSDGLATPLPADVEMRLREELEAFMRLSFLNQLLLLWVLRGGSAAEFGRLDWLPQSGRENGMLTRQAVNERLKTLKKTCPGIAGVICQMVKLNSGNRGRDRRGRRGR